jgi:membrane protease YdiL (CAAX protease family)
MPSPAAATCIVYRFRWREMADAYGLDFRKLDFLFIVRSSITFFVLFFFVYPLLIGALGNLMNLPGVGKLTFSSEAVWQEITRSSGLAPTAQAPLHIPLVPLLVIVAFPAAIIAGFSINGLFALGEELGWRGFLWSRLPRYGFRGKLLLGIVWGLWHAPIILLGYNFPVHPYLGVLFLVFLTVSLNFPLTYLRDRSRSVYSPSVVHGMINACGIFGYIVVGKNELIGSPAGLVGCVAILLAWSITVWIVEQRPPLQTLASDA